MCGIVGRCVGGQKSAFGCMSLRTFMVVWIVVCCLIAVFEFIAGSYFTSAKKYIDEILLSLRLIAADAGVESGGNYYYDVLEKSFATLWKTAFVLTAIRGLLDFVVTGIGIYGVWTKKSWALYTFLAVNMINFIVDFVLFLASIVLINSLYITWFYPVSSLAERGRGQETDRAPLCIQLTYDDHWEVELVGTGPTGSGGGGQFFHGLSLRSLWLASYPGTLLRLLDLELHMDRWNWWQRSRDEILLSA
ncbi:transmembrane protein [Cystoisospora suis]|uniref:Transmembrane protein n=1 Tax=Cystoisospora suis TaxID=483139 RepID=A0A2C6KZ45_9APIC|nr:transmembrane protein [Cystoisospora suis]